MIYFGTKNGKRKNQCGALNGVLSEESFVNIIDNSKFEKPITIYSKKFSESCQSEERIFYNNKRAALYKTEMCRSFSELGTCKYGDSCQFCHSEAELRIVERHPKYKTEICRTFWLEGSCPYGKRCCFAHLDNINLIEKAKMLGTKQRCPDQDNAQLSPFLLDIDDVPPADLDDHISGKTRETAFNRSDAGYTSGGLGDKKQTAFRPSGISKLKSMYFDSSLVKSYNREQKNTKVFAQDLLSKKNKHLRDDSGDSLKYFTFNRYHSGCFEPVILDSVKNTSTRYISIWRRSTLKIWCDEPLNFILDISETGR